MASFRKRPDYIGELYIYTREIFFIRPKKSDRCMLEMMASSINLITNWNNDYIFTCHNCPAEKISTL